MKESLILPLILVATGGIWIGFVAGSHGVLTGIVPGAWMIGLGVSSALRQMEVTG